MFVVGRSRAVPEGRPCHAEPNKPLLFSSGFEILCSAVEQRRALGAGFGSVFKNASKGAGEWGLGFLCG